MAGLPPLDFSEFVDRRKNQRVGGTFESGHEYTYASDKQTRAAFERVRAVELVVSSSVRIFQSVQRTQLLGNAVKVSENQFPRIHALAKHCADTLQIPVPRVYIVNNQTLNAATYGTNEESFIMVNSALVDHFNDEELLSVIGHECGHIHNSHVVYLTALHYLTTMTSIFARWAVQPAQLALSAWSRRAEITCDRAGMLCSKSEAISTKALTKLALGSHRLYEQFNVEAFIAQYEESKDGVGKYLELLASHPWLPKRVLAMRVFKESDLFKKSIDADRTGGLSMKEVDARVLSILKGDA